jgi:taurine dioxygenase
VNSAVLQPVGIEITGFSLQTLDLEMIPALKRLIADHGVLILPGQEIDDADFVGVLQKLGPLTFTKGETEVVGCPDLNVVSNVGRTGIPRSTFHVDTSYVRQPPAYTALRAVRIPVRGGETLFTNQYAAYDTLPPEVRDELEGRMITHVATGVELDADDEAVAEHPVFLRHPISGRTALYLSTPQRCAAISGMPAAQATRTVGALYEHSTREVNTYRHRWSPGDVVVWDNRCVLHRADHANVVGDRILHRGLVVA